MNVQTATPDYVPKVGDVVEFEYEGNICKGLVFRYASILGIASNWNDGNWAWEEVEEIGIDKIRKISHTDKMLLSNIATAKAIRIAEAYFASKSFTPTGSYEERQAQWVKHHEIKFGDKVKVARKWKNGEDGYVGSSWDFEGTKARMQGKVYELREHSTDELMLTSDGLDYYFPYFALEPVKK